MSDQEVNSRWKIWREIEIGNFHNMIELVSAIEKANCVIGEWANDLMHQPSFVLSCERKKIQLTKVTLGDLGLGTRSSYAEICRAASNSGLIVCPAEVGPQLRLQYLDQPYGEWCIVSMIPIKDSQADEEVFCVQSLCLEGGIMCLGTDMTNGPERELARDMSFIFLC